MLIESKGKWSIGEVKGCEVRDGNISVNLIIIKKKIYLIIMGAMFNNFMKRNNCIFMTCFIMLTQ